jgi:hypothetical protein
MVPYSDAPHCMCSGVVRLNLLISADRGLDLLLHGVLTSFALCPATAPAAPEAPSKGKSTVPKNAGKRGAAEAAEGNDGGGENIYESGDGAAGTKHLRFVLWRHDSVMTLALRALMSCDVPKRLQHKMGLMLGSKFCDDRDTVA